MVQFHEKINTYQKQLTLQAHYIIQIRSKFARGIEKSKNIHDVGKIFIFIRFSMLKHKFSKFQLYILNIFHMRPIGQMTFNMMYSNICINTLSVHSIPKQNNLLELKGSCFET